MGRSTLIEKRTRVTTANAIISEIAKRGRKFLSHKGHPSRLSVDYRGRIWYHDAYTSKRVYTHYSGRWRGFSEGGTMRTLVKCLAAYVAHGILLPRGTFGPWPQWMCDGDVWGYGADMKAVRDKAEQFSIIVPAPAEDDHARS